MTYVLHVLSHPLGVVVYNQPELGRELLIPGEACCGVSFEELKRIANTTGKVEVQESVGQRCPL